MITKRYLLLALTMYFLNPTHLYSQSDTIIINNSIRIGEVSISPIQISLSNNSTISGIQFDLQTNPNYLDSIDVRSTIRTKDQFDLIDFTKDSNGNITVVALSTMPDNLLLPGKGNILSINYSLRSSTSSGTIKLNMSNVILIDKNGRKLPTFIQEVINQKILFDESHHERNSISDEKAKILNPEFPDRVSFSTLRSMLSKDFIVENYPSGTITPSLLKNYDVLILSAPEDNFSSMEISSIASFVNEGGSLCYIGDNAINEGINSLLKNFGIQFISNSILKIVEPGQDPGIPTFVNFINHPSLGPNPKCLTSWGGSYNISPPAIAVGFSDSLTWRDLNWNMIKDINEPLGPFTVMTASVFGKGKIFCTSDNSSFNNDYARAYGTYNNDLLSNAIKWLTDHIFAPLLLSPINAGYTVSTQTKFEWTSGNYTKYRFQVSKSEDFKSTVIDSLVNTPSVQLNTLKPKTQYFWRVSAIYYEEESSWSDIWNFTTKAYSYVISTGNSTTIKIPISSTSQLFQIGDEIGVFTPQGLCVGSEIWNNKDLEITVWGDNLATPAVDGIKTGEQFSYRILRKSSDTEQNINCLTYSQGDGKFTPNGISIVSSLKLGLSKAGTITGSTAVCMGQNSVSYSVPTIVNATSYIWSLPNGATGTSTTNSIIINYGSSAISGNLTVKGHNDCGDGDISTLPVIINPTPDTPIITQNGKILSSNATAGNQWYNQNNPISGATSRDYTITSIGEYTVQVTANGCVSSPSNMIKDVVTSITSLEYNEKIKVYPNPVSGDLTIEYKGNLEEIKFGIYSSSGQLVTTGVLHESTVVHTSSFSSGLYTIKFNTGKTFDYRKVIKHN